MALVKGSEPWAMTATQAANRRGWAARSELRLRNALEAFCRERWSDARVVHEIVMGAGKVRADVAAIGPGHIAAFEVKGDMDDTTRLLHQVGMFQLCVPEVWMVVAERHAEDAEHINYLLPSVGLLIGTNIEPYYRGHQVDGPVSLTVAAEAVPRDPVPKLMLEMLWAAELRSACAELRVSTGPRTTRPKMIAALMEKCSAAELLAATCAQLRARDALWRADDPVVEA